MGKIDIRHAGVLQLVAQIGRSEGDSEGGMEG